MASLRRMASVDSIHNVTTPNPSCTHTPNHLVRHSSLPNIFLCQPELAIGALTRCSSLTKGSSFYPPSKPTLCRAMSSSNPSFDYDELLANEVRPHADTRVYGPFGGQRRDPSALSCNMKKAVAADLDLDLQKSVVYSDLSESMYCGSGAPPRFFRPYDMGQQPHTLHESSLNKGQNAADVQMHKSSVNDVKARPMSLRMLKRKLSKTPPQAASVKQCKPAYRKTLSHDSSASERASLYSGAKPPFIVGAGDSVLNAFTSLVYMFKMLQQYALSPCMQSHSSCTTDGGTDGKCLETWVGRAYLEMLESFLWLFQQIFSCTPKLMLLTMMLLANFTLHSVSKHVAFPVMPLGEPPTPTAQLYKSGKPLMSIGKIYLPEDQQSVAPKKHQPEEDFFEVLSGDQFGGGGDGGHDGLIKHIGSYSDDDGLHLPVKKMTSENQGSVIEEDGTGSAGLSLSLLSPVSSLSLSQIAPEIKGANLDATTKNMLVAPVRAPALEADNYPCFDRTDLAYQHEISMDPSNPLLLANYAQFLHVVRHDHSRAEKLYRRAVIAEGHVDGEVMGRFASFLWVAKGDVTEADDAYKAAVAADPTNAYHAGCYAHFLWSSSVCNPADETSGCSVKKNVSTISQQLPTS